MTRLLEQAVETVSTLPEETQDELARILLQLAGVEQPPYQLTPEEAADLDASLAEAERGEFATDEEVRAMWAKHGTSRDGCRALSICSPTIPTVDASLTRVVSVVLR
jgi:predicted transcriptional regulator